MREPESIEAVVETARGQVRGFCDLTMQRAQEQMADWPADAREDVLAQLRAKLDEVVRERDLFFEAVVHAWHSGQLRGLDQEACRRTIKLCEPRTPNESLM